MKSLWWHSIRSQFVLKWLGSIISHFTHFSANTFKSALSIRISKFYQLDIQKTEASCLQIGISQRRISSMPGSELWTGRSQRKQVLFSITREKIKYFSSHQYHFIHTSNRVCFYTVKNWILTSFTSISKLTETIPSK